MKSMKMTSRPQAGFTLIELMIVVAIIGVLAAIAIPQYSNYVSRTRAAGAMAELASVKTAIAMCVHERTVLTGCSGGTNGISMPPVTTNVAAVQSITDGVIRVTTGATDINGTALTIIDTPAANGANLVWTNSGTSCDAIRGFKPGAGDCQ